MPEQIIPIEGLHTVGMVMDQPAVSLPPNAFSDVLNVRFDNSAINKMPGEMPITVGAITGTFKHVAWWPNPNIGPNDGYFLIIHGDATTDNASIVRASTGVVSQIRTNMSALGDWQHTIYQGGYAIIFNNGIDRPLYALDATGNTDITEISAFELPGWDSYHSVEETVNDVFDSNIHVGEFDLGRVIDFTMETVILNITSAAGVRRTTITFEEVGTPPAQGDAVATLAFDPRTNSDTVSPSLVNYLTTGDTVVIIIRSRNIVQVRADVIRAWGDVLVAGGLTEMDAMNGNILRNQPGVVRISDVAAPGGIPHNWNPYSVGVSTADEFTLSTTGIVRDLVELQGNLYVYTDSSIHSLTRTGNTSIPYIANVVTNSYGALTRDAIHEFNGQHIVVGSNDIYSFSGHPASIQSIAADRVQDFFYEQLDSTMIDDLFILLHRAENELWINYNGTHQLIWNYRYNVWSLRNITNFNFGVIAPQAGTNPSLLKPTFVNNDTLYYADASYTDVTGTNYESYFERVQAAIVPEFDVETLSSIALWTEGTTGDDLRLRFRPTDYPGAPPTDPLTNDVDGPTNVTFNINEDYKSDIRLNGRFINYRITDATDVSNEWSISGMQLQVMKGGRR